MTAVSKVSDDWSATIPREILEALNLRRGDAVLFELRDGTVVLKRAPGLDREYLKSLEATLDEWLSQNDEEAYRGL